MRSKRILALVMVIVSFFALDIEARRGGGMRGGRGGGRIGRAAFGGRGRGGWGGRGGRRWGRGGWGGRRRWRRGGWGYGGPYWGSYGWPAYYDYGYYGSPGLGIGFYV